MEHTILIGLAFVWLGIVSFILLRKLNNITVFLSRTKKNTIDEALREIIKKDDSHNLRIQSLESELERIKEDAQKYIRKTGIIRYNPFGRLGGDQSFTVALLDSNKSGLVVNFMYTREGIRVYSKHVVRGKGKEHALSQEEQDAVEKAS